MALFAGKTVFVLARGLVPGLGEVLVTASTASALRDQDSLAGVGQVGDSFAGLVVVGDCAEGNVQDHVPAGVAGAIRAFAVTTAVRLEFAIVAVAQKRIVVRIRFEINTAAVAAVAAR